MSEKTPPLPDWAIGRPTDIGWYEYQTRYGLTVIRVDTVEGIKYVPLDGGKCEECDGDGVVICEYDHEHDCPECSGTGIDCEGINWHDAMTAEEYSAWCAHRRLLESATARFAPPASRTSMR